MVLARRLGVRTVAEGIETQEELEILLDLDCDVGQGFLFGKPMAVGEWLEWMQGKRVAGAIATSNREREQGAG